MISRIGVNEAKKSNVNYTENPHKITSLGNSHLATETDQTWRM